MQYLTENQIIPKELEQNIKDNQNIHHYFDISFKGIKPKNYCGFLSINNDSYFIVPKIADEHTQNLNTFIYMLIYAYDINLKNEDLVNADNKEHQIFEFFIRLFSDALLDEFKRGVFKQYITMQENLKVLRGKYIIEKNFTNFGDLSVQDKYQMFAYSVNFKVNDTMLLYPKYLIDVDEKLELGRGDEMVRLEMRSLDLGFDGGYNGFIKKVRSRLEYINV